MKIFALQAIFLAELSALLPAWKFANGKRQFKRVEGSANWFFHITFVKRANGFDALGDVAVEFVAKGKRVAILGAQLANIARIGYSPHSVESPASAIESAKSLAAEFQTVGMPFLQRYSDPVIALATLQAGGREASLISPLQHLQAEQALALQQICAA